MFRVWVRAGPFKCYVTQLGVGGGCQLSRKKALRGGGWGSNFQEKSVRNILMAT